MFVKRAHRGTLPARPEPALAGATNCGCLTYTCAHARLATPACNGATLTP